MTGGTRETPSANMHQITDACRLSQPLRDVFAQIIFSPLTLYVRPSKYSKGNGISSKLHIFERLYRPTSRITAISRN